MFADPHSLHLWKMKSSETNTAVIVYHIRNDYVLGYVHKPIYADHYLRHLYLVSSDEISDLLQAFSAHVIT